MAQHKQAEKRHRQSLKRRERNMHYKSTMRTYLKRARAAVQEKSPDAADAVRLAVSYIDRVGQKGIIPSNRAARIIGRLMKAHAKSQA